MPGNTPELQIPYATPSDQLADWPALNQTTSERIEALFQGGAGGKDEVVVATTAPVPVADTPELWVDLSETDTGGAPVSGVWGTAPLTTPPWDISDQDSGDEVYLDSTGRLRSRPQVMFRTLTGTAVPSAYPVGQSVLAVAGTNVAGWPNGWFGTVVTIKRRETGGVTDGQTQQWFYRNNNVHVFYRWAANDAGGWSAWQQLGGLYADLATSTANTSLTTTADTDITGATLTVPVVSTSSVYRVSCSYDVTMLAQTAVAFIGKLSAGGALQNSAQAVWVPGTTASVNCRQIMMQQWQVTGLAAGNQTFKAVASSSTANLYRTSSPHSSIAVTQVA
jgi:hypothetical protein